MSSTNKRIAEVRKRLHLTQAEFAEKIFITKGFLSSIEIESRRVTGRVSKLVSTVFGVNEDWLKTGEGAMFVTDNPDYEIEEIVNLYKQLNPSFRKIFRGLLHDLLQYERDEAAGKAAGA